MKKVSLTRQETAITLPANVCKTGNRSWPQTGRKEDAQTAIDANRKRLGKASERVHWLVANITQVELGPSAYDVWHERAVFHFLTLPSDRLAYVRQVTRAVKPGGNVIVSTFGPEGPTKCSGLEVVRYDVESLHQEFGVRFRLLDSCKEMHRTPFGIVQQFLYCLCRIE